MRLIRASRHHSVRAGARPTQARHAFVRHEDERAAIVSACASLAGIALALSALLLAG